MNCKILNTIEKELQKDKPRKDILLPLMKSTFYTRRRAILRSDDAVTNKLEKYSALKMPPLVNFVVLSSNIFLHSFHLSFYLCVFLYTTLCPSTFFLPLSFLSFLPFSYFFMGFIPLQRIYLFIYTYLFVYLYMFFLFTYSYLLMLIYLFILLIISSSFLSLY